jgi:hypothetical protein
MTDERIAAISARSGAATAGPWTEHGRDVDHDKMVAGGRNPGDACGLACEIEGPPEAWHRGQFQKHSDADFIAHAREDVPYLLARLREVERERDEADDKVRIATEAWDEAQSQARDARADAEALRLYARHDRMCAYRPTYPDAPEATCDCGFDAVLAASDEAARA